MFTNRSECVECGHNAVCGLKGHYREFKNNIQNASEHSSGGLVEDKNVFFALAECRQWTPVRRQPIPQDVAR